MTPSGRGDRGKDFILAHDSADEDALVTAIIRGGYEYQVKSAPPPHHAASESADVAMPALIAWPPRSKASASATLPTFATSRRRGLTAAPIPQSLATSALPATSPAPTWWLPGGQSDDREGAFIRLTLVEATDPATLMAEEIFLWPRGHRTPITATTRP
jgi:1-pyrroline-5-carboxylate dehydrogenase